MLPLLFDNKKIIVVTANNMAFQGNKEAVRLENNYHVIKSYVCLVLYANSINNTILWNFKCPVANNIQMLKREVIQTAVKMKC